MNRTVSDMAYSLLSYALLGLIQQKPASGYDLRKVFTETPLASLSASPGAIYPALRRLEERKLVTGIVEGSGLRQRKMLRVTAAGCDELKQWLKKPLAQSVADAERADQVAEILRFAFFDNVLGEESTLQFLCAFEAGLKIHIPHLRKCLNQDGPKMALCARLALENGVLGYEAQLKWVSHAIHSYKKKVKQS